MDLIIPFFATLGIGGLLGLVTGIFLKQTARVVGCMLGLLFILMQVLAYYGIAQWHWDVIAHHGLPATQHAGHFLWKVVRYNLPFTGGFGAGLWIGLRRF